MGRGRAKAKQTKVARELKYHAPDWDPSRLEGELRGNGHAAPASTNVSEDDEYVDPYAYDPYDEGEEDSPPRRR